MGQRVRAIIEGALACQTGSRGRGAATLTGHPATGQPAMRPVKIARGLVSMMGPSVAGQPSMPPQRQATGHPGRPARGIGPAKALAWTATSIDTCNFMKKTS